MACLVEVVERDGRLDAAHEERAVITWQERADLLAEARRRSPRRERELIANAIDDVKRGAKAPRMSATDRERNDRCLPFAAGMRRVLS